METLIPVLLPVSLPISVPVQHLPQSQLVVTKTLIPLILFFWRHSLSLWVVSGRQVVGHTAKLRCGRIAEPLSAFSTSLNATLSDHKLLIVCDKTAKPASTFKVQNCPQIKSRLRH